MVSYFTTNNLEKVEDDEFIIKNDFIHEAAFLSKQEYFENQILNLQSQINSQKSQIEKIYEHLGLFL